MKDKTEIVFPVEWHYKIIVNDRSARNQLDSVLQEHGYSERCTEGNSSKTGKFQAYRVSIIFNDKESMDNLSNAFSALSCVKFML